MKPNLIRRILNFTKSIFIWGIHGFKFPEKDVLSDRKLKCVGNKYAKSCVYWNKSAYFRIGGCDYCGCSKVKLYLKDSECPIKKW